MTSMRRRYAALTSIRRYVPSGILAPLPPQPPVQSCLLKMRKAVGKCLKKCLCIQVLELHLNVYNSCCTEYKVKRTYAFSPGRVAQSVGHLTRKSGVLGSIPGLATYFRFSFHFFKKGSCQLLAKVCARSTG